MRKAFILLMLGFAVFAFQTQSTPESNLTDYKNKVVSVAAPSTILNELLPDEFKTTYDRYYCYVPIKGTTFLANLSCCQQSGSIEEIVRKLTNTIQ